MNGPMPLHCRLDTVKSMIFSYGIILITHSGSIYSQRLSHKMHPLQQLVSWKSQQDPSQGDFSYSADPEHLLQSFTWDGSRPHRRSSVWTNNLLHMNYMDRSNSTISMTLHRADDEVYMSFGMPTGSFVVLVRMEIDYSGKVNILSWERNMSVWKILFTQPEYECNTYGYCGPYGYCDNTQIIPGCKCLDGFEPRDGKGWIAGRFSQGCRRKEVLRCTHGDGFLTFPGMKVPDKFLHVRRRSFDQCTEECRSNCACVAYAYSSMSNMDIDGDDTRCLVWTGDLIDMENCTQGGENLYVRTTRLRGSKQKIKTLEIVLPAVSSFLILTCIGLIWFCGFRVLTANQGGKMMWKRLSRGDTSSFNEHADWNTEFPILSFREIAAATNNFSESSILGQGGFGNVYKGTLGNGTEIAVKRLRVGSVQAAVEFKNEIALIAKLQHRNLVKLIGCCIHEDEKLLIYEYLPNGSLDAFIFDDARKSLLNWPTRFKIITGVARGLLYLHQDSRLMMIHRDLKASNILLDAEMSPKISDFGTARIFGVNEQQEHTNRVIGTFGYMAPEYAMEGIISVKSDVYSFGVLLLEIVSGLKIGTTSPTRRCRNLIDYAWSLWKDGNIVNLVDSSIVEGCSLDEAIRCIHIGLLMVQDNPNARPPMPWVVSGLDNKAIELMPPKEPDQFFGGLNSTFIALIPKKDAADKMKDFRPISLRKAARQNHGSEELVHANQSAFIRGRSIQDNFILVREAAVALHRGRVPTLLLKLDVAKAFDSVSWSFLLCVLHQRGFGPRCIRWIALQLWTVLTKVLVNGHAGRAFGHGRRLRQGDPLSPLLFVLVMDVLAGMFRVAESDGVLASLAAFGIKHRISLYADDVVVFAKPASSKLNTVRSILECFGGASGLQLNFAKSSAAPIRRSELHKWDLQFVLDKLASKLAHWKAHLMTKEGRMAYVQFIMKTSVVYHLMALDLDPWFLKAPKRTGLNPTPGEDSIARSTPLLPSLWAPTSPYSSGLICGLEETTHAVAPAVVALVKPRFLRRRTVQEGILGHAWVLDIAGELSVDATVQFLRLWEAVARVPIGGGDDGFRWKWTATARSPPDRRINSCPRVLRRSQVRRTHVWNSFALM
ncbi:hypothetical protein QYE76_032887 [Lolium multiflorum]|uniref:Uncharacterized protein n=1 Tax=Lolium multiflorum TaxID=4521 RepID=A0AAD8VJT3_LOLMU|nr:hypothetical protein QYE76_032887 [Lolium multiflorum]